MRAPLWRRVLMMFFGAAPGDGVREELPAPRFGEYPLQRRVVAGLLGVPLPSAGTRVPFTAAEVADAHEPCMVAELPALVLSAGPERKRRGGGLVRAVLAGAVGVAAVGGVALGLMQWRSGEAELTGPGAVVEVGTPLAVGDCVVAAWPGGVRFDGVPRLTEESTCTTYPDGQVLAVVPAESAAEARREGPVKCEQRTRKARAKLPDVRSFAVVPTRATFQGAGRVTSCLVLGAHGPVYGPLDAFRKPGYSFLGTANMQKGDCLDVVSSRSARLASCSQPHDEEVLGFARFGSDMTFGQIKGDPGRYCEIAVPPAEHGYASSAYSAGSWVSELSWESGAHYVVCTVRRADGAAMAPKRR
ncbi:septum formation family protein [Streptomyces sp. NBC_00663]|uniref:septum formation family protein n=1 Tax=Streptomyces sp. NBC_00663 TaxID=2975801 RepID=UPI002E3201BE|nr:septum formation family protein [Streptomyces sp. NBC_00663]